MQKIKFRCFYDGEYHYSDERHGDGHEKVASLMNDFYGCELDQWTGLKDKEGVEIYEGDTVRLCYGIPPTFDTLTVIWFDTCWWLENTDTERVSSYLQKDFLDDITVIRKDQA